MKTYADMEQADLDACTEKPEIYRKLMFNCAFFHAIV
jgi:hypothetical protein